MDTRKTTARIIEAEDSVEKILGGPEFVGSRKDIDQTLSEWSRELLVEIKVLPGFQRHPNRVWISAIPSRTMDRFEEDFDEFLMERNESVDDLVLAIYESNEAAVSFRRSAVERMDQIVLPDVEIDCPFDCDVWLKRKENDLTGAPSVDGIKPDGRRA